MRNNTFIELLVMLVLIALAAIILNPLHIWMPDMVHMTVLGALLVVFATLAAFVLGEAKGDERDVQVRLLGGRIGFLAGAFVLVCGIALESLHGQADPWLVFALLAMLVGKVVAHLYSDTR